MGKLLFTENGGQIWRNFADYRVMLPDGRMSRPRAFAGTIVLSTGDGEPRGLEFHLPDGRTREPLRAHVLAFAIGVLAMRVLDILVLTFHG